MLDLEQSTREHVNLIFLFSFMLELSWMHIHGNLVHNSYKTFRLKFNLVP